MCTNISRCSWCSCECVLVLRSPCLWDTFCTLFCENESNTSNIEKKLNFGEFFGKDMCRVGFQFYDQKVRE